jgi:hypothetical protein
MSAYAKTLVQVAQYARALLRINMVHTERCTALPPKADMCSALAHVGFVPIADIRAFTQSTCQHAARDQVEFRGRSPLQFED